MDAHVIGSGPNGLAAAVVLARAGVKVRVHEAQPTIGGGVRSAELTLPGFVHDVCSAIHPLAPGSPLFQSLPLREHGLEWVNPPIAVAHPLDDGSAGAIFPSLDETVAALGADDGPRYRRLIGPLAKNFSRLMDDIFVPIVHWPKHPLLLARFGLPGMLTSRALAGAFDTRAARGLIAGLAAHAILPLESPFTATFAVLFAASAHAVGWPFPKGGSQKIADALVSLLRANGGEVVAGSRVSSLAELGDARAILFDTSAPAVARIAADRLTERRKAQLAAFRSGPGVFKVDYALSGPVPWRAEVARRAGTVHVGGTFEEIAQSEAAVERGEHPERPFVLVAQQSLFDDTRAPSGKHTLWAYCHVPNGSSFDMTERIEAQLERFAPGFRDLVLARAVRSCAELERENENYLGGDIGGGSNGGLQLFGRPRLALDPYRLNDSGLYLCSAATPPGAGVHGMCGLNAANSALKHSFR